jgi:hypothetical protein
VLVKVRSDGPCAVVKVEEEDHALADVDEKANVAATSVKIVSYMDTMTTTGGLLCEMLVAATSVLVCHAAYCLTAHDFSTE